MPILTWLYYGLLEIRKARFSRFIHSPPVDRILHPHGWEPEVIKCLCETKWNGPVWDVGASVGKLAFLIAQHHKVYAFEPNLNALHYLGYNTKDCENVVLVPVALTVDGQPMTGSIHPDFLAPPTGPKVMTLSLEEALAKFGKPGVIKIDIEGGEYELLKSPLLRDIPLLVEWHKGVPTELEHWKIQTIDPSHSLLLPKRS